MINGTKHWKKLAIDAAKGKAGAAWSNGLLSPDMKQALLCREFVFLMLGTAASEREGTDMFETMRATLAVIEAP